MQRKIASFLRSQTIFTLATHSANEPYCASCFYAFDEEDIALIFASDPDTRHMREAINRPRCAGNVYLCTDNVAKIQGVQLLGKVRAADERQCRLYFEAFPIARTMRPKIWAFVIEWAKMTDNTLGFGHKISWTRSADR